MKKAFIVILAIIYLSLQSLSSFPGDHKSLTCDANFREIPLSPPIVDSKNAAHSKIDDTILSEFYRKNATALTPTEVAKRNQVITAIKADLAKPYPDSIVKKNIRDRIETSYEGKEVHVTKWGDSLSDFVQFYGIIGPAYPYFPQYGQQGYYGGTVPLIDSWSDYFSIFGKPNYVPVYVKNYGYATYTTNNVLGKMGITLENTDINWWDSKITDDHCIKEVIEDWFIPTWSKHVFNGKSQLYSTLMIGGG